VLFLRRCHGAYVVGVTGPQGNDDAGARSSDVHETGVAHRISRSHLISTAQQMQEAACPHRIALKKVRNRYLQSFAKRRMLLGNHL
jgi:hypothetical protein